MTTLKDKEIKEIVQKVAEGNHVDIDEKDISTAPAIDSAGPDAIEVIVSIVPYQFKAAGSTSSLFVSQVHQRLAEAGEERMPIVWFGEKRAS
ncbi:MAG TPA: hypothetical protein VKP67_02450 [Xanthobacteraceae bacterium]|nr:hypothetical protein [Xanthobacteraceae bacterium]